MHNTTQLKQDILKIIELTECVESCSEAEYSYALQMNVDHYFDKRMPPYNGDVFKDIKCLWESRGGKDAAAEESKEAEEV